MIAESGKVYSLEQLGNAFLTFVKKSNVSTPPWEVLTTTLSTFYGATIRVPITKHKVNDKVPYFYIFTFVSGGVFFTYYYTAATDAINKNFRRSV